MSWEHNLLEALLEQGMQRDRAIEIVSDALAESAAGGMEPPELFGPARQYAELSARALRTPADGPLKSGPNEGIALDVRDVSKRYRRRTALARVSLAVHRGEAVAIVGANGAGKSTLLNICAGLVRPTTGQVRRPRRVGLVPQSGGTSDFLSADEHFALFGAAEKLGRGRARASGTRLAGALGWRPRPGQPAGDLSGGTRQKLNVVLGELNSPDLLLLDEPYQGFDQGSYLDLWDQIDRWRRGGTAVLIVTHLLGELNRVDRVVELNTLEAR